MVYYELALTSLKIILRCRPKKACARRGKTKETQFGSPLEASIVAKKKRKLTNCLASVLRLWPFRWRAKKAAGQNFRLAAT
jgi:hypothetical protein